MNVLRIAGRAIKKGAIDIALGAYELFQDYVQHRESAAVPRPQPQLRIRLLPPPRRTPPPTSEWSSTEVVPLTAFQHFLNQASTPPPPPRRTINLRPEVRRRDVRTGPRTPEAASDQSLKGVAVLLASFILLSMLMQANGEVPPEQECGTTAENGACSSLSKYSEAVNNSPAKNFVRADPSYLKTLGQAHSGESRDANASKLDIAIEVYDKGPGCQTPRLSVIDDGHIFVRSERVRSRPGQTSRKEVIKEIGRENQLHNQQAYKRVGDMIHSADIGRGVIGVICFTELMDNVKEESPIFKRLRRGTQRTCAEK